MIYKHEKRTVTVEEIEIKSCPFCGSDEVKPIYYKEQWGWSNAENFVKCCRCGAKDPLISRVEGDHTIESIKAWNRRN